MRRSASWAHEDAGLPHQDLVKGQASPRDLYGEDRHLHTALTPKGSQWPRLLSLADIFPGGGGPLADVFAIAIAIGLFALLYWAIDLIDRI